MNNCHITNIDPDWIGSLPKEWTLRPLKSLFRIVGGSTPKSDVEVYWDGDVVWITPTDLGRDGIAKLSGSLRTITPEGLASCATTMVPPRSIILSTRAPIGSLGVATVPLCTNQGCKALVPGNAAASAFFAYLLSIATDALQLRGKGTTFLELSADELGAFKVPVPPLPEQTAIATFLDRETGKTDALVEEQKRLIELLKEKRQAVISHAVTKGLNPDARMKASGVEWLGEVPEHWAIIRGRSLFQKVNVPAKPDDGVVTAFRDGQVTLRERRRTDGYTLAILEVGYQHVDVGDLVINGMDAFAGAIGVAEASGKCTPEYAILKPLRADVDNEYFSLALRLMATRNFIYVICPSVRERAPRFRFETFKDVELPVPPLEEQLEIVELATSLDVQFTKLTTEVERNISLLMERRAALISATVTGKIDVSSLGLVSQAAE
ncbi:MAG: restriction endonuclease subunit S [Mesorhizobium sp.]|nr:MAG: restriction endonuclease subunit S [Mesorhizobium sp.]